MHMSLWGVALFTFNHRQGAYETAANFEGECGRYASLRREMWGKPYLHPDDFQHVIVGDLVIYIRNHAVSRRLQSLALARSTLGMAYGPT